MKTVLYDRYGGPEALELREVPVPEVGPRECLVRVAAVSVNPADWKLLAGAGGGVGHFVIQLGKAFGAEVTAVCSSRKMALCRELGAARVVDYEQNEPRSLGERFDLVFDCALSIPFSTARSLLGSGGEYLLLATHGNIGPFFRSLFSQATPGKRIWTFLVGPNGARLGELAELFERHHLRVVAPRRYPLDQTAAAFRESIAGHATGKILIGLGPHHPLGPEPMPG